MSVAPKTLDEHRDYLFSIVRLKLWFLARWQKEHPDEDFSYITLYEGIRVQGKIYIKGDYIGEENSSSFND